MSNPGRTCCVCLPAAALTRRRMPPLSRETDETWMPPGKEWKDYNRLSKEVTDLRLSTHSRRIDVERRGILKAFLATLAAAWTAQRTTPADGVLAAQAGVPQTRHIRLYVEMDVAPGRERELLDLFHNQFVPEAVKH